MPDGKFNGIWPTGSVIYAGVVIVANIKLFNSLNIYTFWGELIIVLSVACYFLALWLENLTLMVPDLFGVWYHVMTHYITYLSLIFCVGAIHIIDISIIKFKEKSRLNQLSLDAEELGHDHMAAKMYR
jgi:hypothetical protein